MARKVELIKLKDIKRNPLNIFDAEEDRQDIESLAASIKKIGLESPIVVYLSNDSPFKEYKILSGHRRYEALKINGVNGNSEIPCIIEDAPKNETVEREVLLQNNLTRKKPEELEREVKEASNIWSTMESATRSKYEVEFKNDFLKKHPGCDDKYFKDNFRPRCDYIRKQTGLDISNRTVTNVINRYLNKSKEGFPLPAKKERDIKFSEIMNKILSLSGVIETYELGKNITDEQMMLLAPVKDSLKEFLKEAN